MELGTEFVSVLPALDRLGTVTPAWQGHQSRIWHRGDVPSGMGHGKEKKKLKTTPPPSLEDSNQTGLTGRRDAGALPEGSGRCLRSPSHTLLDFVSEKEVLPNIRHTLSSSFPAAAPAGPHSTARVGNGIPPRSRDGQLTRKELVLGGEKAALGKSTDARSHRSPSPASRLPGAGSSPPPPTTGPGLG